MVLSYVLLLVLARGIRYPLPKPGQVRGTPRTGQGTPRTGQEYPQDRLGVPPGQVRGTPRTGQGYPRTGQGYPLPKPGQVRGTPRISLGVWNEKGLDHGSWSPSPFGNEVFTRFKICSAFQIFLSDIEPFFAEFYVIIKYSLY